MNTKKPLTPHGEMINILNAGTDRERYRSRVVVVEHILTQICDKLGECQPEAEEPVKPFFFLIKSPSDRAYGLMYIIAKMASPPWISL
jgi:hypothetical protein